MARALNLPETRARLTAEGAEPVGNTPAEFATYIRAEAEKYARVIKASGARAD
jgi:tripartite-type tricarboxylate transporter receptor subunit TctC